TGRRAESVVEHSQKSVQRLAEIEQLLASEHIKTEQNVDAAIKKLDSINEIVQEHLNIFNSEIVSIKGNVENSLKEISDSSEKLKNLHSSLADTNENIWKRINEQLLYAENANVKFSSQSDNINAMLEMQKNSITEVINNLATQARLGEASLAQQYKYLTDALVETTQKMQEINNLFKQNSGNIFDTTNKLSYEFDVLGDKLLKSCDMINKASNDSIKSIDKTTLRLNQCSEDLDISIQNSVKNIGSVFTEYEKYLAGFNTVTAETSSSVMEINNLVSVQSDKMVQISNDTKKLVDLFNNVLSETSNQLADRANDAYDKIRGLGKDLKQLGLELDEAAKHSVVHMEQSGNKLRASVNEIATNVERISNSIVSSGDVFIKQSQALSAVADSTAEKVNNSLNNLVEAGKSFTQQGEEIIKGSLRFNDTVNTQTKTLAEISLKAEETMKNMTTFYKDVKIDAFLKDAEKIINSLESTSVDINRFLNPKDEEDLWKKFYNGDKQVFIRYINKNINNTQVATLRKEYEKNANLRNIVNKYISEFEALVEKSKTYEHSGSLMALISGADLGRLYYVLAKILNKLN
ncbi:MAG: hypothetical protein MJ210_02760, partial [Alphaproteobacteria bacterium]|nr:hypothetical protein [Alphaproteobacteria bacterium]